jgi:arylsulfatase A-like enzyme
MSVMLDSFVDRVETALVDQGLMDNTILVYASDNGAQVEMSQMGAGSNFPLRGSKGSLYEGAVRVPAFVYSPLLGHQEGVSGGNLDGMFHVSDWLPTLMSAAGRSDVLDAASLELDGVDQWNYLLGSEEVAPRSQVLINADTVTGISALRMGNYKLLLNESQDVGWYSGDSPGLDLCFMTATQTVQLFDVVNDQEERQDLSLSQPELVASLRAEIDRYMAAAPAPAYCGVADEDAVDKWWRANEVEPWIKLDADDQTGLPIDYTCPDSTTSSGWCTMVDANTALPPPPTDGDVPMSMGGREIKMGSKEHDQ